MVAAGTLALQSFFLLSGFLITVLLVRESERGRIDLKLSTCDAPFACCRHWSCSWASPL